LYVVVIVDVFVVIAVVVAVVVEVVIVVDVVVDVVIVVVVVIIVVVAVCCYCCYYCCCCYCCFIFRFSLGIRVLSQWELAQIGIQSNTFYETQEKISLFTICIYFIGDFFIYLVLALYLDTVIPGVDFGRRYQQQQQQQQQ